MKEPVSSLSRIMMVLALLFAALEPSEADERVQSELRDYQLIYELELARLGSTVDYNIDESATFSDGFDRIAYLLELGRPGERIEFVCVSMDAFTDDVTKIGIPTIRSQADFQTMVTNLSVLSNVDGIDQGEGLSGGNIEFWPNKYAPLNGVNIPGANAQIFDFGDQKGPLEGGYGCMQVHNHAAGHTVFAINNWNSGAKADIGIGNSLGQTRDWTFTANALQYDVKRLRILVRPTGESPQSSITVLQREAEVPKGLRLAAPLTSNMVLQRDVDVPIWGTAGPNENISVTFNRQSKRTTSDKGGKWNVVLSPMKAGGPHEMSIECGTGNVTLENVLIGEVWICTGQSNMDFSLGAFRDNYDAGVEAADMSGVRLIDFDIRGKSTGWRECNPATASDFSATGFFFGRELYRKLGVPIGLVEGAQGGTQLETWMSPGAAEECPELIWGQVYKRQIVGAYYPQIKAMMPYAIRGAIWYQGEMNGTLNTSHTYAHHFAAMIKHWRKNWGLGDFPVLYVQLPNYLKRQTDNPKDDSQRAWPALREAQRMCLNLENTGMAVTIDIGMADNIHPVNKLDVGMRLAFNARALVYGEKGLVYSGPIYRDMANEGNRIRLNFDHVGGGLVSTTGKNLQGFGIAGDDMRFVWADAVIDGGTVLVSSPRVPNPKHVVYAWAINPIISLFNRAGLPASPFQTWTGPSLANDKGVDGAVTRIEPRITSSPSVGHAASTVWEHSFQAGTTDRNGHYMGGSTIVHLVGHRGKLFAGNSYWHDSRNIWYGGKDPKTGWAQVLRLDEPGGEWEVDFDLGPNHLRVEILKSLTFTTDGRGRRLSEPVNLLAAAEYSGGHNHVDINFFCRNDRTGEWEKGTVHSGPRPADLEDRSCRAMRVYRDRVTGVERVFLSLGKLGVISGVYDPRAPGKVRWDPEPESGPVETRVLALVEANDSLLFSAGRKIYRRIDGESPSWETVHDMIDLFPDVANQPIGGIRGLSAIPAPGTDSDSLLFAMAEGNRSRGAIYRLDPAPNHTFKRTREVYLDSLMSEHLDGNPVYFILAAYNDIYTVVDPLTGERVHLIGFESWIGGNRVHMWGFDAKKNGGFYAGGMYAIRDSKGNYRLREINGPASPSKPPLVATCVFARSPFPRDLGGALYFAGHDGNHRESTNHAWIFRATLQNVLHDDVPGEMGDPRLTKAPAPSLADQQQVLSVLGENFNFGKNRNEEQKRRLAEDLLMTFNETERPVDRFVLLRKVAELAGDSGDAVLMCEIVDRIGDSFQIDPLLVQGRMFQSIAANATNSERIESLVEATDGYIDRAVSQRKFTYAQSIALLAYRTTQTAAGEMVRQIALDRLREVEQLRTDQEKVK